MNIGITHVFSCINICWNRRKLLEHVEHECSSISWGARQVLMQWNKHVWSLFVFLIPTQKPTENCAITLEYHFLHCFSPNKMASALNFQML